MPSLAELDELVRGWLVSHHSPVLDLVMVALSAVGRRGAIWIVFALVLTWMRPGRAAGAFQLLLAIGAAYLMTDAVLKPLVARDRPFVITPALRVVILNERPTTYSFPSGHATSAFAGAVALRRIWPACSIWWWTLASLIAFSRVYLGVHYPSDVLAGGLIGVAVAYFVLGTAACYSDRLEQ